MDTDSPIVHRRKGKAARQPVLDMFEVEAAYRPETASEKELRLEHAERQELLLEEEGFYAANSGELSLVTNLSEAMKAKPGYGVRAYFGNILQSRVKTDKARINAEDEAQLPPEKRAVKKTPQETLRSITRDVIGYIENARAESAFVGFLNDDLERADLPTSNMDSVDVVAMRQPGDGTQRAVIALLRHVDNTELANGNGADHINDDYYSGDPATVARLKEFVTSLTVTEARDMIKAIKEQQSKRSEFWVDVLKQLVFHTTVSTMASEALEKFGKITRPE